MPRGTVSRARCYGHRDCTVNTEPCARAGRQGAWSSLEPEPERTLVPSSWLAGEARRRAGETRQETDRARRGRSGHGRQADSRLPRPWRRLPCRVARLATRRSIHERGLLRACQPHHFHILLPVRHLLPGRLSRGVYRARIRWPKRSHRLTTDPGCRGVGAARVASESHQIRPRLSNPSKRSLRRSLLRAPRRNDSGLADARGGGGTALKCSSHLSCSCSSPSLTQYLRPAPDVAAASAFRRTAHNSGRVPESCACMSSEGCACMSSGRHPWQNWLHVCVSCRGCGNDQLCTESSALDRR
jgi:hypothetical protein